MKKIVIITLTVLMISMSVNAKKIDRRIFVVLTKAMLVTSPTETIKHQNVTVSFWQIPSGGFYYITETQEFRGKYKLYNFTSTSNKTTLGIDKKMEKRIKKDLRRDIISSQY